MDFLNLIIPHAIKVHDVDMLGEILDCLNLIATTTTATTRTTTTAAATTNDRNTDIKKKIERDAIMYNYNSGIDYLSKNMMKNTCSFSLCKNCFLSFVIQFIYTLFYLFLTTYFVIS